MECPRCGVSNFYKELAPRVRKRDGAIVVTRVCKASGCGYGINISAVIPDPILADKNKQLLFKP